MMQSASLVAGCFAAILLSACTPTSSPTPTTSIPSETSSSAGPTTATPSPNPTPTWSVEQSAAIETVGSYRAASQQIGTNPSSFTESQMKALLRKSAGPEVVAANTAAFLELKERGLRYDGLTEVVSTRSSRASDVGHGREVVVTLCVDQRNLRVVDKSGAEVSEDELGFKVPDFNLRQYTVQKRADQKVFRVYGTAAGKGECGP